MKTLKEKEINDYGEKWFEPKDVEQHTKDFNFLLNYSFSAFDVDVITKEYYFKNYGIDLLTDSLQDCYIKIFGDFEK